ncbi:unnamed protein product [Rotaria sp. Silwood1]|nr:unnamed protein product [Rotaria sp. Silwood1]CAF4812249.1 unnamed protein product [Rotaria sp. Silwood1]
MFDRRNSSSNVELRRANIMNDINRTHNELEQRELQHNGISKERKNRCILLVGLSKTGKTTLMRVLADPQHVPNEPSLRVSSATTPSCYEDVCANSTTISLTVVELPSTMIDSNSDLSNINKECARLGIDNFHLICFCTTIDIGIRDQDVHAFERFLNHFGKEKISSNLCMIITRFESKTDEERRRLRDELMNDAHFRNLTKWLKQGIHFSGALNYDDWRRANDSLCDQFESVYNYRKDLLALIESDIQPFYLQPIQPKKKAPLPAPIQSNVKAPLSRSIPV